jgi:hypothetical protein
MILFIDPISENIRLSIIDDGELRHTSTPPKWRDYDELPDTIVDMMDRHDIDTIWCITGPWAFTRMRIVTLMLNSLKLTRKFELKGCHFFDIIDTSSPILKANDREYIIRSERWTQLINKEDIPEGSYIWYGDQNDFTDDKKLIQYKEDIHFINEVFGTIIPVGQISPIYLKDPHITWSKKNTYLSWEKMKK